MVFGLFGKKKPVVEVQTDNSQEIIAQLQQEKKDLESRLTQAQEENQEQQTEYDNLRNEYEQLEKKQKALFKTAERQIKKEVEEVREELKKEYLTNISALENQKKELNVELQRKLNELSKYKRETASKQAKLKSEIDKLNEKLADREKQHQEYLQAIPKIEERLKEIVKKKKSKLLSEGDIVTATLFESIEEERRKTGYNALGPNGEIFYVRTNKTYAIGEDVTVIVKSLPVAEAAVIDNPDIKLEVGKLIDFKKLDIYERNKTGLVAICQNEDKLIIEVGEHVTGLGNKKIEVYKEEDGVFYAKRV